MSHAPVLPPVTLSEQDGVRHLHLGTPWIQGSMRLKRPQELVLQYVQRMMAWLLFVEPDGVAQRRALQFGLGAGSITRFCHHRLGMHTTAVELNPQVVAACRGWFRLPDDGPRLQVIVGDAAHWVHHGPWQGAVDALSVDLYDHEAAAPVLDSADFYAACRALLTPDGCMSVNLFGRCASLARSMATLQQAFGAQALWVFKPTREGNTVVLAQRQPQHPPREVLQARAETIRARWGLPAPQWLRSLRPWSP
ncbi:spermidine synthase [Tepidimonas aquatica]|uniref:Polyamine aminopropyltransferase n=1 Tax=Tepidimonas aquatica TaxID=247482 RepID=A0A554WWB0_9BURK|nr:spermidine synthase [Tepidimonas aquatica]MCX7815644.1 spermidine synthase [Tepidimonas ignava]TSE27864.1 Polyamine aminopropyltransferase [Tepidimonas aquatica]